MSEGICARVEAGSPDVAGEPFGAVRQATLGGLRPTSTVVVRAGSDGSSWLRSQPSTTPNRS